MRSASLHDLNVINLRIADGFRQNGHDNKKDVSAFNYRFR